MQFIKRFHKAQPAVSAEPVPSLTLIFEDELPELASLPATRTFYMEEGKEIAASLHSALPGGIFDQVLAEMLQLKASHFRVPWGDLPRRIDPRKEC